MKKLLLIAICFVSFLGKAQIKGSHKDLKDLTSRPLIVEILEEDSKTLKDLSKPKRAGDLYFYKNFIKEFNEDFKNFVQKYWKLNRNIEYKGSSEIEALNKQKNKSYAVIRFLPLLEKDNFAPKSGNCIPSISYSTIENDVQCRTFISSNSLGSEKTFSEKDYRIALETLQSSVNWSIENGKSINGEDYIEKMATANCSKLTGKTLLVADNAMLKESMKEGAKQNYGENLKFVSEIELNDAYANKNKNSAVLITVPYGVMTGGAGGGFAAVSLSMFVFYKIIVDCETGEILWMYKPHGLMINPKSGLTEKEFKFMANCKI